MHLALLRPPAGAEGAAGAGAEVEAAALYGDDGDDTFYDDADSDAAANWAAEGQWQDDAQWQEAEPSL